MSSPARPTVAIVGGGRVGQALGKVLTYAGYPITDVVCRTLASARKAIRFIGAGTPRRVDAIAEIEADVLIFAIPDDEIASTAARLADARASMKGVVALHTSGALDSSALEPLRKCGADVGSMHPLQSFSSPGLGASRVMGSMFALEGSRRAVSTARAMARAVGGRPITLKANAKPLYHAAAVMASGHVTALIDASLEAMRGTGMGDDDALAAILPLIWGTLDNIGDVGTVEALTGPFARGDEGTVARNRAALAALDEGLIRVYETLGDRSRVLAARKRPLQGRKR